MATRAKDGAFHLIWEDVDYDPELSYGSNLLPR